MVEVWKDIDGYEGLYQVSTLGRVRSLGNGKSNNSKERVLIPGLGKDGYLLVNLWKDGKHKSYKVHRLVAEVFISNPNVYPCVHHKNELKTDNREENLQWVSQQFNTEYSCGKPVYCVELNKVFPSAHEAFRQTGVYQSNINSCLKGRGKTAGGYHWQYA